MNATNGDIKGGKGGNGNRPRIRVPHPDVHRIDVADDVENDQS
jgi:hypothetical protein